MSDHEAEWRTRKKRIDPKLDAAGWRLPTPGGRRVGSFRSEEEGTDNGPADYALWLDNHIAGVVEAKKLTVGPQNVLTQAQRYAKGLPQSHFSCNGFGCPFLYATNGEVIWFQDIRHSLNRSRRIAALHTPSALKELLDRDFDAACEAVGRLPHDHPWLRPYQKEANAAIEQAIADRKRNLLVAMATGTGKTVTLVNEIYRLMKAGVARRVLFLVDRRALAAQAVRAFSAFDAEPNQKFDQIYEVYSSRFQMGDFDEDDRFDPKALPQAYLTDPQPGHAFVYVCTIQRMAINILGRQAIFGLGDETLDDDVDRLDIPIHAFDVIVADECHRGYTSQEVSTWRSTLDHFDAIKLGLTATPASHTTAYFTTKVFAYGYEQAVQDGYLVDYDAVRVRSEVRVNGVFLREGEHVEYVDPETGLSRMDQLEDERQFDATERWPGRLAPKWQPKPPPQPTTPGEHVWTLVKGGDVLRCELRTHTGAVVEVQLFRNEADWFMCHRHPTCELALEEATTAKRAHEADGWRDVQSITVTGERDRRTGAAMIAAIYARKSNEQNGVADESAAARRAVSHRMKQYWARRRKAGAK